MSSFKQLIYISVFGFMTIGISQAADLNESFLGVKWGTHLTDLPDFVKVAEKHSVIYCGNPKKSYTLFNVEVPYVTYAFYADKFFAAYVDVASIDVFGKLKEHISRKYGSPRTTLKFNQGHRIYNWKYQDTKIKLKLYENEGKMKLGFYYEPLTRQVNKALQEAYPPPTKPILPFDQSRLNEALEVMGF